VVEQAGANAALLQNMEAFAFSGCNPNFESMIAPIE
jgi:hypothetical protein